MRVTLKHANEKMELANKKLIGYGLPCRYVMDKHIEKRSSRKYITNNPGNQYLLGIHHNDQYVSLRIGTLEECLTLIDAQIKTYIRSCI